MQGSLAQPEDATQNPVEVVQSQPSVAVFEFAGDLSALAERRVFSYQAPIVPATALLPVFEQRPPARVSLLSEVSEFTERPADDVLGFVVAHLDEEEREWLDSDMTAAASEAVRAGSLAPIGEVLADWEATVEIKLDPALSRELHEALREGNSQDELRHD